MAVGANFLNHPTALKNAAQITAETCDVTIKFGTGGKPYIYYKQPGGRKQINSFHYFTALLHCPRQLTEGEREELHDSWSTRTDHQVDSEDHSQTGRKLSKDTSTSTGYKQVPWLSCMPDDYPEDSDSEESENDGEDLHRSGYQFSLRKELEQQSCQDSILGKTGLKDEYSQTAPQTAPETAPQTVAQSEEPEQLESEERSRSEMNTRSTAGSARRLSPSTVLRNPTPPAPAQLANPSPPSSAQGRKRRSPTRRSLSTIRDQALSARIEEFERQVESIIHYAEHGGYNELDRVRRAPRRQSPSPEARNRSNPAPTPTPEPGPLRPPSPAPASRLRTPTQRAARRDQIEHEGKNRLNIPRDRGKKPIRLITRLKNWQIEEAEAVEDELRTILKRSC